MKHLGYELTRIQLYVNTKGYETYTTFWVQAPDKVDYVVAVTRRDRLPIAYRLAETEDFYQEDEWDPSQPMDSGDIRDLVETVAKNPQIWSIGDPPGIDLPAYWD